MEGNRIAGIDKQEVIKLAPFLDFGFYMVSRDGKFLECDDKVREIFKIPLDIPNLIPYSIADFCLVPEEWNQRLKKLEANPLKPLKSTISVRVKGKIKQLYDICWRYPEEDQGETSFIGLLAEIESGTISPKMYENLPRGLYQLDNDGRIVLANHTLVNILKFPDEAMLLKKKFHDLCIDQKKLAEFDEKIKTKGFVHDILVIRDYHNKEIEVDCFCQETGEFGRERWGMITEVTMRERYYRDLESVPTGYYYIVKERIKFCNDHFAKLMGFGTRENAIGRDTRNYFASKKDVQRYFEDLREADKLEQPLQNYPVRIRRASDGVIVTLAVDSHLVKNSSGQTIGRRGTIRDISSEIKLKERVKAAENRLTETTADINSLIHNFLHPVVKFSGNSELIHQIGKILHQTAQKNAISTIARYKNSKELGEKLLKRLIEVRDVVPDSNEEIPFSNLNKEKDKASKFKTISMRDFKKKLSLMINIFDYSLSKTKNNIILDGAIRDTALWLLDELYQINYSDHDILKHYLNKEFMDFLQDILFNYLTIGTKIMANETKIMKMDIDALRRYIGTQLKQKYVFKNSDIEKIVIEALEPFRPVFSQAGLEILLKKSGNLTAIVSVSDLTRVFNNLFQNARKYSFPGKSRFVKINIREIGNKNQVEFSITNLGIPIKNHEIKQGLIFLAGYRSQLAYANDRDGTGVGLADARDVIMAHGGTITISSDPTKGETEPPNYKVPYITTVTLTLPKFGPGHHRME